jgi:hypothetical protein
MTIFASRAFAIFLKFDYSGNGRVVFLLFPLKNAFLSFMSFLGYSVWALGTLPRYARYVKILPC